MKNLMKIQLKSMLFRMRQSGGKRMSGALILGLLIFSLACIELLLVLVWSQMTMFCSMGLTWLYFSMAGIMALALAVFGSVFMTQTQLYDAKDNELLLSMPIRPLHILMSRMAVLLVLTGVFSLAALLPAYAVYAVAFGVTAQLVIGWVLSAAALILLAQAVCCALGWVLHWLLSRLRNKAAVSLAFTVLFLVLYFYFYANANNLLTQLMLSGEQIAAAVQGAAWPLYAVGMGMSGSLLYTLFTAALGAGAFALVSRVLAASFAHGRRWERRRCGAQKARQKRHARPAAGAGCLPQGAAQVPDERRLPDEFWSRPRAGRRAADCGAGLSRSNSGDDRPARRLPPVYRRRCGACVGVLHFDLVHLCALRIA